MLGNKQSHDLTFLVFNSFTGIDDNTLKAVAQFDRLEQLRLNGEISITDAGLGISSGLNGFAICPLVMRM